MLIRRMCSPQGTSDLALPGDPSRVQVFAPAKINLYLEVLGKRPDGYHAIETVMLAVGLFDELTFAPESSRVIQLTCDATELSTGRDNLVVKAARLLQERTGCANGAKIGLVKRIPWAAGLGGGSSDAAATLAGLNELWELGLSTDCLASLGAELGSDVPFFFHAPAARCTGRGEVVEPVKVSRAFAIVLVKPPEGISTAEAYRQCDLQAVQHTGPQAVINALAEGDIEKLARSLHNRLQEPAMRICPPVADLYRRLQSSGAAGCLMTGSGSCLFALCHDEREAGRVVADMQRGQPNADGSAMTRMIHVQSCL